MVPHLLITVVMAWLTLVHISCYKQSVVYIKRINNQSQQTIYFYFKELPSTLVYGDTVVVHPGEVKDILRYKEANRYRRRTPPCHINKGTVESYILGGGQLTKQLTRDIDWSFTRRANNQICTFVVNNEDIL